MSIAQRAGGSFAPPLTDDLLLEYGSIVSVAPQPFKDAVQSLLNCVKAWWELPESGGTSSKHPSGRGVIVPLDVPIAAELEPLIPWKHEIAAIQGLLETIPVNNKQLRDAAYHLLWHVRELDLDREPITNDLL